MSIQQNHTVRRHIDHRFILQLRLFSIIFLITLGLVILAIVRQTIALGLATGGILIGLVIGIVVSRMYRLSWDEQTAKVVGQIDWIGGAILAMYIVFLLGRNWIVGHWVQADTIVAFGVSISTGSMLGRVVGARHGILKTLEALGVLKPRVES